MVPNQGQISLIKHEIRSPNTTFYPTLLLRYTGRNLCLFIPRLVLNNQEHSMGKL
jgi:hypothetical protein